MTVPWVTPVPGSFVTYHIEYEVNKPDTGSGLAIVFEHRDFAGRYLVVDLAKNKKMDYTSLNAQGFNDLISSIVIITGRWIFYSDNLTTPYVDGVDNVVILDPGMYSWVEDVHIKNDDVSSFRPIS